MNSQGKIRSSGRGKVFFKLVCTVFLFFGGAYSCSSEQCKDKSDPKCKDSCEKLGECQIKYFYRKDGSLIKRVRICELLKESAAGDCGKCWNEERDKEGKLLKKTCVVCNLCNSDFQCLEDGDCGESAPYCQRGKCVPCRNNGDCKDSLKPFCSKMGCLQCLSDRDCKDPLLPSCIGGQCMPCNCKEKEPNKPKCLKLKTGEVRCVQCKGDSDCSPPTPICKENTCRAECKTDRDCPSGLFCFKGKCSECLEHSDCKNPQKPRCFKGTCLCLKDSDCPSKYPVCSDKKCYACLKDRDCPPGFPICSGGICSLKPCQSDADCTLATHSSCRKLAQRKVCVGCLRDSDCEKGETCDLEAMTCKKKISTNP